jgi:hypothetical protein
LRRKASLTDGEIQAVKSEMSPSPWTDVNLVRRLREKLLRRLKFAETWATFDLARVLCARRIDALDIDDRIGNALTLMLAMRVIRQEEAIDDWMIGPTIQSKFHGDKSLEGTFDDLVWIWRRGLLKILLTVYFLYFERKDVSNCQGSKDESRAIFDYISRLARLERNERRGSSQLCFCGQRVRFGVVLIEAHIKNHNPNRRLESRVAFYSDVLRSHASSHPQVIFVLAAGSWNIECASLAVQSFLASDSTFKNYEKPYLIANQEAREIHARCIALFERTNLQSENVG